MHFWKKSVYTYVYKDHLKDNLGQEMVDATETEIRKNWWYKTFVQQEDLNYRGPALEWLNSNQNIWQLCPAWKYL